MIQKLKHNLVTFREKTTLKNTINNFFHSKVFCEAKIFAKSKHHSIKIPFVKVQNIEIFKNKTIFCFFMFLLLIMGSLDLFAAIMLLFEPVFGFPFRLVFGGVLYLLLKAYLFRGDFLSVIDGIIGLFLFIGFFFPWHFMCFLFGTWLFLKSAYSIINSLSPL